MLEGYKTIQEIAKEWELTPRQIQNLCAAGRIPGVGKFGNACWKCMGYPKGCRKAKRWERNYRTV